MPDPGEFRGNMHRPLSELPHWFGGPAEEALEPERPIVDPHHHLWDDGRGTYLLPEFMADVATGHNVVATVFVECSTMYRQSGPVELRPLGETEFANGMAAMSASGRFGPCRVAAGIVGFADLTMGDRVEAVLERHRAAAGDRFRGIRHATVWDGSSIGRHAYRNSPQGLMLDPTFRAGFARLAANDLVFDAFVFHPQIADVTDLARAYPDSVIVLNHVGTLLGVGPYARDRESHAERWRRSMADLARCPNVHVKLGGLGMVLFGFGFHLRDRPPHSDELAAAWHPTIMHCIDMFGPERCMFESNFPVDKQSCSYVSLWNAFKKIAFGSSETEKHELFHETAARVYRIAVP